MYEKVFNIMSESFSFLLRSCVVVRGEFQMMYSWPSFSFCGQIRRLVGHLTRTSSVET